MPVNAPDDSTLGAQLRHLVGVGASPDLVGRFACAQLGAGDDRKLLASARLSAMGDAIASLVQQAAPDFVLGGFVRLQVVDVVAASSGDTPAATRTVRRARRGGECAPDSSSRPAVQVDATLPALVSSLVEQALERRRTARGSGDGTTQLKLTLQGSNKVTTVSVPRSLHREFIDRLGKAALVALLGRCGGPLSAGQKRSGVVQAAMQVALQAVRFDAKVVPLRG